LNNHTAISAQETKSSVGDKYETGLEMLKQEYDKLSERLLETIKKARTLEQIRVEATQEIQLGSLVSANHQKIFIFFR
jgi:hypothetical protein